MVRTVLIGQICIFIIMVRIRSKKTCIIYSRNKSVCTVLVGHYRYLQFIYCTYTLHWLVNIYYTYILHRLVKPVQTLYVQEYSWIYIFFHLNHRYKRELHFVLIKQIIVCIIKNTGCSEKKYNAQNRYSIQTTNDREMKQRPIDS